eukprot:1188938-Pyramimonas_sp.AAC.1
MWMGQGKRSWLPRATPSTQLNSSSRPVDKLEGRSWDSPLSCWMDEDEDGMIMMCCGALENGSNTFCKYPDPGCLVVEDDDGMPVFVCQESSGAF